MFKGSYHDTKFERSQSNSVSQKSPNWHILLSPEISQLSVLDKATKSIFSMILSSE